MDGVVAGTVRHMGSKYLRLSKPGPSFFWLRERLDPPI